jgi:periplasmic protein TonB
VKVVVAPSGRVESAVVIGSSGDARLDQAAVQSVLRWRYRPGRRAGRGVPSVAYATVRFLLPGEEPSSAD